MSARAFVEVLGNLGPDKQRELAGAPAPFTITDFYVYVGPGDAAIANLAGWKRHAGAGGRLWAWYVNTPDQAADVARMRELDAELNPFGWVHDIEGEWVKGTNLSTLAQGTHALGKPWVASLAASSPDHNYYDHRSIDRYGGAVEFQAYFDSGEGSRPSTAVEQLWRCGELAPGRQYRARIGKGYGWSEFYLDAAGKPRVRYFPSGKTFNGPAGAIGDPAKHWPPYVVSDWTLKTGTTVAGELLGLAAYADIRVALDVTRGAASKHSPAEWTTIAASARAPGKQKRGVTIYLLEVIAHTHPDVVRAIAAGGGPNVL